MISSVDKLMKEYCALLNQGYTEEEAEVQAFMIVYGYFIKK